MCICVETGNATDLNHVPKEDVISVLADYLSGMTLVEDDPFGLKLPEKKIPEGYHLTHKRFSKRIVYKSKPGFSITLSRELSWSLAVTDERSRESVLTTKWRQKSSLLNERSTQGAAGYIMNHFLFSFFFVD